MTSKTHVDFEISDQVSNSCASAYSFAGVIGVCIRLKDIEGASEGVDKIIRKYACVSMMHLAVYETVCKLLDGSTSEAKPHYHVFMFIFDRNYSALRQAITRIWSGNENYSLKKAKPELVPEQINYLCKGKGGGSDDQPDFRYRSEDLTDVVTNECRTLYWKNNAAIQAKAQKRKREPPVLENIVALCRERHFTEDDPCKIYDVIVEFYRKRHKFWRSSYIQDLVWTVRLYLSPGGSCNRITKEFCIRRPFN